MSNRARSGVRVAVEWAVFVVAVLWAASVWSRTTRSEAGENPAERAQGAETARPSEPAPAPLAELFVAELAAISLSDGLPDSGQWRGKPVLADINEDGHADVVASIRRWGPDVPGEGLTLWTGDGRGAWTNTRRDLRRDMGYGGSAVGDVDGDGDLDLAFSGHDVPPHVFLNDRAGGFSPGGIASPADKTCADVALGDIDGDGRLDLAAVGFWPLEGGLWWFPGRGDGSFDAKRTLLEDKHYGAQVDLVDLDTDGDLDLLAATSLGPRIWQNDGQGDLAEWKVELEEPEIAGSDLALAAVDLDGDGALEILCAGMVCDDHPPLRLLKLGADSWIPCGSGLPAGEAFFDVVFSDLDGRGLPEVVAAGKKGLLVLCVDASGQFRAVGRIPDTIGAIHLASGDVDGDRTHELLVVGLRGVQVLKPKIPGGA
ncbi:MAG: VCBS repeat-containing protein [Planctomycetes bacterium]|nr:VCBS repeat-containing protein [Planctomycetota bacterium]